MKRKKKVERDEPLYVISVAARLAEVHPQTLRIYERKGLLNPARVKNRRRYSEADIERCRIIQELTQEMGVNLAGVKMILDLRDQVRSLREQIASMEREMEELRREMERRVEEVHRSYRRDLVPLARGELALFYDPNLLMFMGRREEAGKEGGARGDRG
ncbi:MAG: MerR family transcriptional regulator [Candidatus Geothermincolales bacterium]